MKPGAFTQFYIQLVFSPKHRDRLLVEKIRPRIFEYLNKYEIEFEEQYLF